MHASSLLSRSVRIVPMFVSGYCVHPNVLGPWSIIGKWNRKCVSLCCRPAILPSFPVSSRRASAEDHWAKSCVSGAAPVILRTPWPMYPATCLNASGGIPWSSRP